MNKNIVIAGAGIAGLYAAKAARDRDPDCAITLIDASEHNTYSRTRLPEYISGEIQKKDLFPYSDEWYDKYGIRLLTSLKITEIDTAAKALHTDDGVIGYDSLVIATGSSSNVPPIPGVEKQNVITVRTIGDADKIRRLGGKGTTCTIIGGGLLGLEMAWAVRQLGSDVNVIEFNSRLLPRQIDEQGATLLTDAISEKGIKIYLSSQTQEIYGAEKVEGVRLTNGTEIPSDFVILSTGVKANTLPFSNSGMNIGRAIQVNKYLETSLEGIYAAGDVAEYEGNNFSIWPIAMAQGRIAGNNAASDDSPDRKLEYTEIKPFTNLKIKGITMFSIGDVSGANCLTVYKFDNESKKYIKLFIRDNMIIGSIVFGDPTVTMKIKKAVEEGCQMPSNAETVSIDEILSSL